MSLLFETISLIDGVPQNLDYHQARMSWAMQQYLQVREIHNIKQNLEIPKDYCKGKVKLKIIYSQNSFQQFFSHYRLKQVDRFKLVYDDEIDYDFKFIDRSRIDKMCQGLEMGEDIIIVKNGYLTDASYANLVFKDSRGKLFTPEHSLLKGTKQSKYLEEDRIKYLPIRASDIKRFNLVCRINAMMDLGDDNWNPVESIDGEFY